MVTPVDKPAYREKEYNTNQTSRDTMNANPVFAELLNNYDFLKPGQILIVGCGKGNDTIIAAQKGYEVTALDFSSAAINYAKQLAIKSKVNIEFLNEDIFTLSDAYIESFDYVYEYTTYCAINPQRRTEFAKKISLLVKKGGRLITVLFPVDSREGGPPFSIDVQEFYKNFSSHLQLELSSRQINSVRQRKGKEILQIYYKNREVF